MGTFVRLLVLYNGACEAKRQGVLGALCACFHRLGSGELRNEKFINVTAPTTPPLKPHVIVTVRKSNHQFITILTAGGKFHLS